MTRFCLTVHPIWGRVLGRHLATLGAASFRQDADLEVCLARCTIYMPGIQRERAHQLISECIFTNASGTLQILRPMLAPNLDVIQVHGLCVVAPPPPGRIPLRPGVRAQQVLHHLQGCRKDARLCRPAHQVPPLEIMYEYASVIPVTQRYSRQHGNILRRPSTHWPCPR
jgi:hypothetical protein